MKTKALISFAVTAKLICAFVLAYAECWFSHAVAQIITFYTILRHNGAASLTCTITEPPYQLTVKNFVILTNLGYHSSICTVSSPKFIFGPTNQWIGFTAMQMSNKNKWMWTARTLKCWSWTLGIHPTDS